MTTANETTHTERQNEAENIGTEQTGKFRKTLMVITYCLIGILAIVGLVILLTRAARLRREITKVEHDSESARDLTARMRDQIDAADRLIAKHRADAYRRGFRGEE